MIEFANTQCDRFFLSSKTPSKLMVTQTRLRNLVGNVLVSPFITIATILIDVYKDS